MMTGDGGRGGGTGVSRLAEVGTVSTGVLGSSSAQGAHVSGESDECFVGCSVMSIDGVQYSGYKLSPTVVECAMYSAESVRLRISSA